MAASNGAGTLRSTSINGVKVYSLTGNRYVAPWVLAKKKRALRKDEEYQRRLDLIHDLRFETATTKIKVTPDEQYVIASGTISCISFFPITSNKCGFTEDFQIDEQSKEYLALHPQASIKEPHLIEEHFESVGEDEEEQPDRSASDASAESDSDNDMHNSKRIRLYEVKDDRHAEAFLNSVSLANEDALPLGDRIAALERQRNSNALDEVKYGPSGAREISFISRSSRRRHEEPKDEEPKDFKRRGVQSLGLKQGKAEFYLFGGNRGRGGGGRGDEHPLVSWYSRTILVICCSPRVVLTSRWFGR